MSGDRREQVLSVAAGLFAEHGFHGVPMDQLGAAVGMSGPALYRYFPGKEAILTAMLVDISESLLAGARERAALSRGLALIEELVAFHVAFALDHPDLIAVQFRDLGSVPEPHRRRVRRLQSEYAEVWVEALGEAHGSTDPRRARSAVHAVFGLINSTPHSARLSRDEMARLLRDMARAALERGASDHASARHD